MDWEKYRQRVMLEYTALLHGQPPESAVQRFLELHPALVPYPQDFAGAGGTSGAHGSLHFAVFTQPPLPGIERPVPDFMRIARNSGGFYPILIEIEAPKKSLVNRNGDPSAPFVHAAAQISDWRQWFQQPANQIAFRDLYRLPARWAHRPLQARYVLVIGRRAELDGRRAQAVRAGFSQDDFEIMSFDRLHASPLGAMDMTVRLVGRKIKAVAMSPTFQVGPDLAEALAMIEGKDEAIAGSAMMTIGRRRFLRDRMAHWEQRGSQSGRARKPIWE